MASYRRQHVRGQDSSISSSAYGSCHSDSEPSVGDRPSENQTIAVDSPQEQEMSPPSLGPRWGSSIPATNPLPLKRTVRHLVKMVNDGTMDMYPTSTTDPKWSQARMSKFIASVMEDFPCLPPLMMTKKLKSTLQEDGSITHQWTLIDGRSRLKSLQLFLSGNLPYYDQNEKPHYCRPRSDDGVAVLSYYERQRLELKSMLCCEWADLSWAQEMELLSRIRGVGLPDQPIENGGGHAHEQESGLTEAKRSVPLKSESMLPNVLQVATPPSLSRLEQVVDGIERDYGGLSSIIHPMSGMTRNGLVRIAILNMLEAAKAIAEARDPPYLSSALGDPTPIFQSKTVMHIRQVFACLCELVEIRPSSNNNPSGDVVWTQLEFVSCATLLSLYLSTYHNAPLLEGITALRGKIQSYTPLVNVPYDQWTYTWTCIRELASRPPTVAMVNRINPCKTCAATPRDKTCDRIFPVCDLCQSRRMVCDWHSPPELFSRNMLPRCAECEVWNRFCNMDTTCDQCRIYGVDCRWPRMEIADTDPTTSPISIPTLNGPTAGPTTFRPTSKRVRTASPSRAVKKSKLVESPIITHPGISSPRDEIFKLRPIVSSYYQHQQTAHQETYPNPTSMTTSVSDGIPLDHRVSEVHTNHITKAASSPSFFKTILQPGAQSKPTSTYASPSASMAPANATTPQHPLTSTSYRSNPAEFPRAASHHEVIVIDSDDDIRRIRQPSSSSSRAVMPPGSSANVNGAQAYPAYLPPHAQQVDRPTTARPTQSTNSSPQLHANSLHVDRAVSGAPHADLSNRASPAIPTHPLSPRPYADPIPTSETSRPPSRASNHSRTTSGGTVSAITDTGSSLHINRIFAPRIPPPTGGPRRHPINMALSTSIAKPPHPSAMAPHAYIRLPPSPGKPVSLAKPPNSSLIDLSTPPPKQASPPSALKASSASTTTTTTTTAAAAAHTSPSISPAATSEPEDEDVRRKREILIEKRRERKAREDQDENAVRKRRDLRVKAEEKMRREREEREEMYKQRKRVMESRPLLPAE